jgi:hypothetical protein
MRYIEIDKQEALRMFAELDSKLQKKAHRNALIRASNILIRETRKNIRIDIHPDGSPSLWHKRKSYGDKKNGKKELKPLRSGAGVRVRVNKEVTEAKVHIMAHYMLKWFEMGTKNRFRSRKKMYMFQRRDEGRWFWKRDGEKYIATGKIKPNYFFKRARESKEGEISANMENILFESIRKVHEKYR